MKEVRFHLVLDGKPRDVDVAVSAVTVSTAIGAPRVSWWAEALTEKDAALVTLGDATKPMSEVAPAAPKPVATVARPLELKPSPALEPTPPPAVEPRPAEVPAVDAWAEPSKPAAPMAPLRIVGISLGAGAVVCAGLGVLFRALANGTAAQITGAARDASGRITGLTQPQALTLDAQQRGQATAANVLFVASGALLAGGVTLFLLGGDSGPQVALVPRPARVGLVGTIR